MLVGVATHCHVTFCFNYGHRDVYFHYSFIMRYLEFTKFLANIEYGNGLHSCLIESRKAS